MSQRDDFDDTGGSPAEQKAPGMSAIQVRRGDERMGADGCVHRVVNRTIDMAGAVTIDYDVIRPSGGIHLRFEVVPPDAARTRDTGFATPRAGRPATTTNPPDRRAD